MVLDALYRWVLGLENPLLAALLGGPNLAYTATFDPETTRRDLDRIETAVFGPGGLDAYERRAGADSLGAMARRSYAQYLGRTITLRHPSAKYVQWVLHALFALPLLPFLLVQGLRRGASGSRAVAVVVGLGGNEGARKLAESSGGGPAMVYCPNPGEGFGVRELAFLARSAWAFPRMLLAPPLVTNLLRWLSKYGWIRRHHAPSTLVAFAEGTPGSSLLTAYLREHGIRHVNHMHGERFANPAQAFCCFDEIDVWGQAFGELFLGQRWKIGRMNVAGTPFHRKLFQEVRKVPGDPRGVLVIHTHYLTPGTALFQSLLEVLGQLGPDWNVQFRPHYLALPHAQNCFDRLSALLPDLDFHWQDPVRTPLEAALRSVGLLVGPYSTAMLEGWIAGRKLIHLPTEMAREIIMARYGGSPNVLYGESGSQVRTFAEAPRVDDRTEWLRVDHLVAVLEPAGDASPQATCAVTTA
jgi:hypothetical protein